MEFITLRNKDNIQLVKGVLLYPLKVNRDETGILVESLRKDWPEIYGGDRDFSMQYFSVTKPWIARDENLWHYHLTIQEDRFLIAQGEIVAAVADNREGSQTRSLLNLFHMKADEDPYILLIPKRTLHGFMVISQAPAVLLNFPTALYDPKEEGRIPHKEVNIKLPDGGEFTWEKVRDEFRKS